MGVLSGIFLLLRSEYVKIESVQKYYSIVKMSDGREKVSAVENKANRKAGDRVRRLVNSHNKEFNPLKKGYIHGGFNYKSKGSPDCKSVMYVYFYIIKTITLYLRA